MVVDYHLTHERRNPKDKSLVSRLRQMDIGRCKLSLWRSLRAATPVKLLTVRHRWDELLGSDLL